ncbi:hypothetical protein C8R46DRAFT_1050312 [Mycena filopes]|nr:hypothetical protein C8R46DRAFT_1050312 [Mycena filopes]
MHFEDAYAHFVSLGTGDWPPGMRNAQGLYPQERYEKPLAADVRVACTLHHLVPDLEDEAKAGVPARVNFMTVFVNLFSAPGLYARFVHDGGLRFASNPIHEPYPFVTTPLSMPLIAGWFSSHGIAAPSDEVIAMESYARFHRNRTHAIGEPENITFQNWGPHADSAASLDPALVIKWNDFVHGPLRPGVFSSYPRRPSAPLAQEPEDITMG